MLTANRIADVDRVDEFLSAEKFLSGPPPLWKKSEWGGEYLAVWNVLDADGAPAAVLHCCARITDRTVAGLNLIFLGRPIWRVHIDSPGVCHSNPHDAHFQRLPAEVCGAHEHAWPINRAHVLNQDIWDLPYRRAVGVRHLNAALPLLADQINLTLMPDQRPFEGPTKGDLFDMVGA